MDSSSRTNYRTAPRQRWTRIIPVAFLMYTIGFMDRINIGFGFSGMERSLSTTATMAGLAGGIFFFGYLFLQIPGGHWGVNWSAKKFVTLSLLFWAVFAILTGAVQNVPELLTVRFLLGACPLISFRTVFVDNRKISIRSFGEVFRGNATYLSTVEGLCGVISACKQISPV